MSSKTIIYKLPSIICIPLLIIVGVGTAFSAPDTFVSITGISTSPVGGVVVDGQGNFYGNATYNYGQVYEITPNDTYIELENLSSFNGSGPEGSIFRDSVGDFFGTTAYGVGTYSDSGNAYELTPNSDGTYTATTFDLLGGTFPAAGLVEDAQKNLYGTTSSGGASQGGTVFELVNNNGTYTEQLLYNFPGATGPYGPLLLDSQGNLYGTTEYGGTYNAGTVFELKNNGGSFTYILLYNFSYNSSYPKCGLALDGQGNFFGTTSYGGQNGYGSVFELTPNDGVYTFVDLHDFGSMDGSPLVGVVLDAGGNIYGTTANVQNFIFGSVYKLTKQTAGYSFATLHYFNGQDGSNPSVLTSDGKGNFVGTTSAGGPGNTGTLFAIVNQTQKSQTVTFPKVTASGLTSGSTITLSGSASTGLPVTFQVVSGPATVTGNTLLFTGAGSVVVEAVQSGTIAYQTTASNTQTFQVAKSNQTITFPPIASNFYGVSFYAGATPGASNEPLTYTITGPATIDSTGLITPTGTGSVTVTANEAGDVNYNAATPVSQSFVVKPAPQTITFNPNYSTLYSFPPSSYPPTGQLTPGRDGKLYGVSGANIYELSPGTAGSTYTLLHTLNYSTDGNGVASPLVLDSRGNLYGAASQGGLASGGTVFELSPGKTGYTFKVLHSFSYTEAFLPVALAIDSRDHLFGLTGIGGPTQNGDVFELLPDGTVPSLYNFTQNSSAQTLNIAIDSQDNIYGLTGNASPTVYELLHTSTPGLYTYKVLYNFGYTSYYSSNPYPTSKVSVDNSGNVLGLVNVNTGNNNVGGAAYKLTKTATGPYTLSVGAVVNDINFPSGNLVQDRKGNFYGISNGSYGTIFQVNLSTLGLTTIYNFGLRTQYLLQTPSNLTIDCSGKLIGTVQNGITNIGSVYQYELEYRFGHPPIPLVATGGASNLPVTFKVLSGPGRISNDTLTFTGGGTVVVAADEAGNKDYSAAPEVSFAIDVQKDRQWIFFPPIPKHKLGDAPFCLFGIDTARLPITYKVKSGPAIVTGDTIKLTGAGIVVIEATQAGNSDFDEATTVTREFTVAP